jgi:hypothetical protein
VVLERSQDYVRNAQWHVLVSACGSVTEQENRNRDYRAAGLVTQAGRTR